MKTALKTLLSLFLGGSAGVLENILVGAQGDWSKIDWHKAGFNALLGGILAVLFHWFPPPNSK